MKNATRRKAVLKMDVTEIDGKDTSAVDSIMKNLSVAKMGAMNSAKMATEAVVLDIRENSKRSGRKYCPVEKQGAIFSAIMTEAVVLGIRENSKMSGGPVEKQGAIDSAIKLTNAAKIAKMSTMPRYRHTTMRQTMPRSGQTTMRQTKPRSGQRRRGQPTKSLEPSASPL